MVNFCSQIPFNLQPNTFNFGDAGATLRHCSGTCAIYVVNVIIDWTDVKQIPDVPSLIN